MARTLTSSMANDMSREQWEEFTSSYHSLINNPNYDSQYLRRVGLQQNVVRLIGNCEDSVLLDVGCGNGWLFEQVIPAKSYACDVAVPSSISPSVNFEVQDIRSLTYSDESFDIIVASLVLMWFEDLNLACRQLYRVAKSNGGRLIIALVHPYFYRTGQVHEDQQFLITTDLSKPFKIQDHKIAGQIGPFTYYYRPIFVYVNTLIDAGWNIRKYHDWFIDMADYKANINGLVQTKIARTGHIPLYTFFECIKA
jgi:ubiquinone/menaquinone biosynthesis C-methylase UbiE